MWRFNRFMSCESGYDITGMIHLFSWLRASVIYKVLNVSYTRYTYTVIRDRERLTGNIKLSSDLYFV